MTQPVLSFESVRFAYPGSRRAALNDVTLKVGPGAGLALLGHNGAGKTTLIRLAMAFAAPDAGDVRVGGRSTSGLAPEDLAPAAGYLFQQPEAQLFARTVREELAFGPAQLGWPPERTERRIEALLDHLDLRSAADEHPYDLPTPRRRLVALGTALAAEPALLLLDEPTAGLDRGGRDLVIRIVREHLAGGGAAVAVCHDTGFALEALERSVVLAEGRIVADGATPDVLSESAGTLPLPAHAEIARRLGLRTATLRLGDVAAALAAHCSEPG